MQTRKLGIMDTFLNHPIENTIIMSYLITVKHINLHILRICCTLFKTALGPSVFYCHLISFFSRCITENKSIASYGKNHY